MGYKEMKKIYWREKGTKRWNKGWLIEDGSYKVKIGVYNGASNGYVYDRKDIEIEYR